MRVPLTYIRLTNLTYSQSMAPDGDYSSTRTTYQIDLTNLKASCIVRILDECEVILIDSIRIQNHETAVDEHENISHHRFWVRFVCGGVIEMTLSVIRYQCAKG